MQTGTVLVCHMSPYYLRVFLPVIAGFLIPPPLHPTTYRTSCSTTLTLPPKPLSCHNWGSHVSRSDWLGNFVLIRWTLSLFRLGGSMTFYQANNVTIWAPKTQATELILVMGNVIFPLRGTAFVLHSGWHILVQVGAVNLVLRSENCKIVLGAPCYARTTGGVFHLVFSRTTLIFWGTYPFSIRNSLCSVMVSQTALIV